MEEVAYIAYHFHWSHPQVMGMEHWERRQWVNEIARINQQLNDRSSSSTPTRYY